MTLAVARIVGERIGIAADTLLTEHDKPLPHSRGVIKSCMLPGHICVTFSNSPDLAARDFEHFARSYPRGVGFAETISFFENSSAATGNDYLLAFSRTPHIVKIAEGRRVNTASKTLWIGDHAAFERFREAESKGAKRVDSGRAINAAMFMDEIEKSPASNIYSTMREVVADKNIPNVGGFVSVISNRRPGFRHSVYTDMLFNWPDGQHSDYAFNPKEQIDFGASGENYEYSTSQISTGYLGLNIVGFYLLRARKVFLFFGHNNNLAAKCRVIDAVEPNDIAKRLSDSLGFDFLWLLAVGAAAPNSTRSSERFPRRSVGPSGVGFPIFIHANTFPRTASEAEYLDEHLFKISL